VTRTNKAKESGTRRLKSRRIKRIGAAASGLAIVLACGATGTAVAAPNEPGQLHVEGQLLPIDGSPGVYRVTGGLVGTYKVRSERVINAWTFLQQQRRAVWRIEAQLRADGQLRHRYGSADRQPKLPSGQ
jgi:hypothetical protein